jgi:hypothetical protein
MKIISINQVLHNLAELLKITSQVKLNNNKYQNNF